MKHLVVICGFLVAATFYFAGEENRGIATGLSVIFVLFCCLLLLCVICELLDGISQKLDSLQHIVRVGGEIQEAVEEICDKLESEEATAVTELAPET